MDTKLWIVLWCVEQSILKAKLTRTLGGEHTHERDVSTNDAWHLSQLEDKIIDYFNSESLKQGACKMRLIYFFWSPLLETSECVNVYNWKRKQVKIFYNIKFYTQIEYSAGTCLHFCLVQRTQGRPRYTHHTGPPPAGSPGGLSPLEWAVVRIPKSNIKRQWS